MKLCDGTYSREDVAIVVTAFCRAMKILLNSRKRSGKFYKPDSFGESELTDDLALDFIAHKFGRDKSGCFFELKKYFAPYFSSEEEELKMVFNKFIFTTYTQRLKEIAAEEDSLGCKFFQSLKYLLIKHTEWEKVKTSSGMLIIKKRGQKAERIGEDELRQSLIRMSGNTFTITGFIESLLIRILDERGFTVSVGILNHLVHKYYNLKANLPPAQVFPTPEKALYLETLRAEVREEIEANLLKRYLAKGKFTETEYKLYTAATARLLTDLLNGHPAQEYFQYFNNSIPVTAEQYRRQYRTRFEYIAKQLRKILSAKLGFLSKNYYGTPDEK